MKGPEGQSIGTELDRMTRPVRGPRGSGRIELGAGTMTRRRQQAEGGGDRACLSPEGPSGN